MLNLTNLTLKKTLSNQIRKLREQKRKLEKKVDRLNNDIRAAEELLNKIESE